MTKFDQKAIELILENDRSITYQSETPTISDNSKKGLGANYKTEPPVRLNTKLNTHINSKKELL